MIAIKDGEIIPVTKKRVERGTILIKNGKIEAIGKEISIPKGCEIIDATDRVVMPGLIDAHTHLGIGEVGIGEEGRDYNEISSPVTAQMRAIDGINPLEKGFLYARAGGITTVVSTPGSANVIGGIACAIKTCGNVIDEMVIKERVGLKVAFGENPKRVAAEKKRDPLTRMGVAALLRDALVQAQNYIEIQKWAKKKKEKPPERNLKLENLTYVLRKEIPLRAHAHRSDDIATAVRIAEEFDIDLIIEHGTEAYKIADWLSKKKVPVITGPALGTPTKIETQNVTFKSPKILKDAGIKFTITTDHNVVPINSLILCAIMATKEGLDPEDALRAVTQNPAEILGLGDRIGSIEVGKDADIIILSSDPLDARSKVELTFINGKVVFDIKKEKTPF